MVSKGEMLLAGTLLLLLSRAGGGVICYICQWASRSAALDNCRNGNFDSSIAKTDSCDNGCQTLTLYQENKTTMFTRKCADKTVHRTECKTDEMVPLVKQKYCYCSTNYCNTAPSVPCPSARALLALWLILSCWANGTNAIIGWTV